MRTTLTSLVAGTALAGVLLLGAGTAQAQPAGQWSDDGLTYCDPYCANFDKTAPRFFAEPSAYVCTTGPNPGSAACGVVMTLVRALPPFPFGRYAQNTGSLGN